jgi:pSer/pThr/pTyr-binding forkhead associated (FHA) protein
VNFLPRGLRPRPNPSASGTLVLVQAGRSTSFTVQPGQRVVVGSDASADIVLSDPQVSPGHALIERKGPGWLVTSLHDSNPVMLLDPTGRAQPVEAQLGLRSGEILIGGCQVLLYPLAV